MFHFDSIRSMTTLPFCQSAVDRETQVAVTCLCGGTAGRWACCCCDQLPVVTAHTVGCTCCTTSNLTACSLMETGLGGNSLALWLMFIDSNGPDFLWSSSRTTWLCIFAEKNIQGTVKTLEVRCRSWFWPSYIGYPFIVCRARFESPKFGPSE